MSMSGPKRWKAKKPEHDHGDDHPEPDPIALLSLQLHGRGDYRRRCGAETIACA